MYFRFQRDRVLALVGLHRHRGIMQAVILFCCLEILDTIVTYSAVKGGLVWEGNALIAPIAGAWGFIVIKFIGAVLSGLVLQILHEHFPKASMAAAVSITVFYGAVLAWNSCMILNIMLLQ